MYSRDVTYPNLFKPGEMKTETLYFHLFLSQLIDMQLKAQEQTGDPEKGLAWMLEQVQKPVSEGGYTVTQIMDLFKMFMQRSYGIRDGDDFIQTEEVSAKFIRSAAFDAFLRLMLGDEKMAAEWINAVMPADLMDKAAEAVKSGQTADVALPGDSELARQELASGLKLPYMELPNGGGKVIVPWWNREPNHNEQQGMTQAQLMDVFARKSSGWTPPAS